MFNADELRQFVSLARWVAVNDYEARMLCDRLGTDLSALSCSPGIQGVVVTRGAEGSDVWAAGQTHHCPPVKADSVADPTGCGDAFRAALLFGLERGWPLQRCAAIGNRLGACKIACHGPQNHRVSAEAMLA